MPFDPTLPDTQPVYGQAQPVTSGFNPMAPDTATVYGNRPIAAGQAAENAYNESTTGTWNPATAASGQDRGWAALGLSLHELPQGARALANTISPDILKRIYNYGASKLGGDTWEQTLAADKADRQQNAEANAQLKQDPGYAEGRILPYLVGGASLGPRLAGSVLANAGLSAGLGQIEPEAEGSNRPLKAAVDAATGAVVPTAVKAAGSIPAVTRAIEPAVAKAGDVMRQWGIPIDAAQASGSKMLEMLKRYAADSPLGNPVIQRAYNATKAGFTRAMLGTAGENAESATPDVIDNMMSRIGLKLDDVAARAQARLTPQLDAALARVEADAPRQASNPSPVLNNINWLREQAAQNNGVIPGPVLQKVRTALSGLSKDPAVGTLASDAHDTIMAEFDRQMAGTPFAKEWSDARLQYKNAKVIQNSVDTNMTGDIAPGRATSQMKNQYNKGRFTTSTDDDAVNLVRAYNQLQDKYMNSGTAHRTGLQTLGHFGIPAAVGALAGAYEDKTNPWTGAAHGAEYGLLARAAMAAAFDPVLAKALNNQTLSNVLGRSPMFQLGQAPASLGQAYGEELARKYGYADGGRAKVEKTMHEFRAGDLHSGSKSGKIVTSREQAIAIALNQQRRANETKQG